MPIRHRLRRIVQFSKHNKNSVLRKGHKNLENKNFPKILGKHIFYYYYYFYYFAFFSYFPFFSYFAVLKKACAK